MAFDVLDELPEETPLNQLQVCPRDLAGRHRHNINSSTPLIEDEEDEEEGEDEEEEKISPLAENEDVHNRTVPYNEFHNVPAQVSLENGSSSTSSIQEDGSRFGLRQLRNQLSERSHLVYSSNSSTTYLEAEEELDSFRSLPQFELESANRKSTKSRRDSVFSMLSKGKAGLESITGLRSRSSSLAQSRHKVKSKSGYYITDNFNRRVCHHYIPRPADSSISTPSERCKCGLPAELHVLSGAFNSADVSNTAALWSYTRHTTKMPTNSFGYIDFIDSYLDTNTMPYFLRLDIDTSPAKITELLLEKWGINRPRLIMSVFGESYKDIDENFLKRNSELFAKLTTGLLNAAKTTEAWFFTAGYDCGVSKLIGRAVGNSRSFVNVIPAIGIGFWGAVASRDRLVGEGGLFPAEYCKTSTYTTVGVERPLDPNHTHFLLFDRGTVGSFMTNEMHNKRIEVEANISEFTKAQFISIMIAGDLSSLRELRKRVEEGYAVVIMKGTGRMADILCQFHDTANAESYRKASWHGMKLSVSAMEKTLSLLRKEFPRRKDQSFVVQLEDIKALLRYWKDSITICDCDVDCVDRIILQGLIKSIKSSGALNDNVAEQLKLAIIWNRVDLVEESFKANTIPRNLVEDLLFLALKLDRVSFIRKLLDHCDAAFDFSQFLTEDRFSELLNDVPESNFLRKLLTQRRRVMKRYDKIFPKAAGVGKPKFKFRFEHFAQVIYKISSGVYQCCKCKRRLSGDFDDPEDILVLFCVLEQRQKMAMLFWERSSTPTMLALVACHIYKWMAEKESSYIEITPEMKPVILQYAR